MYRKADRRNCEKDTYKSPEHHRRIKGMLDNGIVGRVKEIK